MYQSNAIYIMPFLRAIIVVFDVDGSNGTLHARDVVGRRGRRYALSLPFARSLLFFSPFGLFVLLLVSLGLDESCICVLRLVELFIKVLLTTYFTLLLNLIVKAIGTFPGCVITPYAKADLLI